jgi:transketolase
LYYPDDVKFNFGEADFWKNDGRDIVFIADGSMVFETLNAAKKLEEMGVKTSVVNIRSIKPIDQTLIREISRESKLIVTVENHPILGGLGGAVAEIVAEEGGHLFRIGSNDVFGESGHTSELREKHQMDCEGILNQLRNPISKYIN